MDEVDICLPFLSTTHIFFLIAEHDSLKETGIHAEIKADSIVLLIYVRSYVSAIINTWIIEKLHYLYTRYILARHISMI